MKTAARPTGQTEIRLAIMKQNRKTHSNYRLTQQALKGRDHSELGFVLFERITNVI
jgi:hypothetical protein